MPTLLIVDDEDKLRSLLARILGLEGYHILQASTAAAALKILEREVPDVILCDVKLPDMSGLDLLDRLKNSAPETEVILLTAYGTILDGVQAIKKGAFDYITKGDDNERIIPLIVKALDKRNLQRRIANLEKRIETNFDFDSITGTSSGIKQAIALASRVAPTNTTVLLQGETGTGKEIFAQAIHQASSRKKNSFQAINCSGFSREFMESELFGYKAGAFTGAIRNKRGLFEEADGGTLFLDEIGEIPIDIQAKLLRVLENGTFLKLGETQERKVDVRIIAATNRDLKKEIISANFREDLYFRISAFSIQLPPLRERKEDIPALARIYINQFSKNINLTVKSITEDFFDHLSYYSWKGNIRELKNVVERAVILCDDGIIDSTLLPEDIRLTADSINSNFELQSMDLQDKDLQSMALQNMDLQGKDLQSMALQSMEARHITNVLRKVSGNKAEAARLLKIGISTLYRKLEEYQIQYP